MESPGTSPPAVTSIPTECSEAKQNGFCPSLPTCEFEHPPPCKRDKSCFKATCSGLHTVPRCQAGTPCDRNCGHRHPKPHTTPKPSPAAAKKSTDTPCYYDAACTKMKCSFVHSVEQCPLFVDCPLIGSESDPCPLRHPIRCPRPDCNGKPPCKLYHDPSEAAQASPSSKAKGRPKAKPTSSTPSGTPKASRGDPSQNAQASPASKGKGRPKAASSARPGTPKPTHPRAKMTTSEPIDVAALAKEATERFEKALLKLQTRMAEQRAQICELQLKSNIASSKNTLHVEALEEELRVMERQLETCESIWSSLHPDQELADDEKGRKIVCKMMREANRLDAALPSLSKRIELEELLRDDSQRFIIVKGHTGSGKSTQLPQYIADMDEFGGKTILCTQPRKIAASTLGTRVAHEFSASSHPILTSKLGVNAFVTASHQPPPPGTRIWFCRETALIAQLTDYIKFMSKTESTSKESGEPNTDDSVGEPASEPLDEHLEEHLDEHLDDSSSELEPGDHQENFVDEPPSESLGDSSSESESDDEPSSEPSSQPLSESSRKSKSKSSNAPVKKSKRQPRSKSNPADPLANIGVILVDEAHERNVSTDLLIGILKTHAKTLWPSLKVIITSASLDSELFLGYFDQCPFIEIPGKTFPVEVIYAPNNASTASWKTSAIVDEVVWRALQICRNQQDLFGVLCFLTGQEEVEKAKAKFEGKVQSDHGIDAEKVAALTLYGRQLEEDQQAVFAEYPGKRKVIFATDVAEASITIDGLGYVVDCGLVKENVFDAKRNASALVVRLISKSSAEQRKGRAGRTGPGTCYRIYTSDEFKAMSEGVTAEIFCKPLAVTVSTLLRMGIHPVSFDWIERPSDDSIASAFSQLEVYGAIKPGFLESGENVDVSSALTQLGMLVSRLQMDPGITNMLYSACKRGFGEVASDLASLAGVISMLYWRGGDDARKKAASEKHASFANIGGDFVTAYRVLQEYRKLASQSKRSATTWANENSLNCKTLKMVIAAASDTQRQLKMWRAWAASKKQNLKPTDEDVIDICASSQFATVAFKVRPGIYRTFPLAEASPSVVGVAHPGSALVSLERASIMREWPDFITFQSIFQTSKTFVSQLTAVTLKTLGQFVPESALESLRLAKETMELVHISISQLSGPIVLQLIGKFGSKIPALVEELGCSSLEQSGGENSLRLSCWCERSKAAATEAKLLELVAQARRLVASQSLEETYKGQTRVVFGSQLSLLHLLPDTRDYVSVNIVGLPERTTRDSLQQLIWDALEKTDGIKSLLPPTVNELIKEVTLNVSHKSTGEEQCWAAVRFCDPLWASRAYTVLVGTLSESSTVRASHGGNQAPPTSHSTSIHVDIIMATAPSTGTVEICLPTDGLAKATQATLRRNLIVSDLELARKTPQQFTPARVSIMHSTRTEDDIRRLLLHNGKFPITPKSIRVIRSPEVESWYAKGNERPPNPSASKYRKQLHSDLKDDVFAHFGALGRNLDTSTWKVILDEKDYQMTVRIGFENPGLAHDFVDACTSRQPPSKLKHLYVSESTGKVKSFGQEVAVRVQLVATLTVPQAIFHFRKEQIKNYRTRFSTVAGQEVKEVVAAQKGRSIPLQFTFVASSFDSMRRVVDDWPTICAPSGTYTHPQQEVLFSQYGKQRLAAISKAHDLYTIQNPPIVFIYTPTDAKRDTAIRELDALVMELTALEMGAQFRLERGFANSLRKAVPNSEKTDGDVTLEINTRFGIKVADARLVGRGSLLVVSALPESMESLKQALEKHLYEVKSKEQSSVSAATDEEECPICDAEDCNYTLQFCGHRFCRSCLQQQLEQENDFSCICSTCKGEIVLADFLALVSPTRLAELKDSRVYRFVTIHGEEHNLAMCPVPTCGQVLSIRRPSPTSPEKVLGGHVVCCDLCKKTYCLSCSEKQNRAVERHVGVTCEQHLLDGQRLASLEMQRHQILDLLNTKCPKCNIVIFDFDGCFAVRCNCGAGFCGFCMYLDPSGDAHTHVRSCTKNPVRNEYFGSIDLWHKLRAEDAKRRVISELARTPNKLPLLEFIAPDLRSSNITISPLEVGMCEATQQSDQRSQLAQLTPLEMQRLLMQRNSLLDLFNTKCPRCRTVIYDFNGCFALRCQCDAALCGFCLYLDPSGDAHAHVRSCTKNTCGGYFGNIEIWHKLRAQDAKLRLISELSRAPNKQLLLQLMTPDLNSSKITISPHEIGL